MDQVFIVCITIRVLHIFFELYGTSSMKNTSFMEVMRKLNKKNLYLCFIPKLTYSRIMLPFQKNIVRYGFKNFLIHKANSDISNNLVDCVVQEILTHLRSKGCWEYDINKEREKEKKRRK
jgi:hypothetical protein